MTSDRKRILVLVLVLLPAALTGPRLSSSATAQPASIPSAELRELGWLGDAVADYLDAFVAEDAEGLNAYLMKYRDTTSLDRTPAEVRVPRQLQYRGMLGAVELVAIKLASESEIRVIVRSPVMEGYFELFFEESASEPGKIGSQGMQPSAPPEDLESPDAVAARGEQLPLAEWLAELREEHAIPALAVAWSSPGQAPEAAVLGVRDVSTGEAVELDDRFHLGSLTKSMTASVIARLVDAGELEFELSVAEALPEMEMQEAYREVTLAMLLQHRAGIDPLLDPGPEREAAWIEASQDPTQQRLALVSDVLTEEPATKPGSGMLYSNAGYVVAAVMAEHASGRSWEALIQSEVFEALGLESAGLGWPSEAGEGPQPRGHWLVAGQPQPRGEDGYALGAPLAPAGDAYSSIVDLAHYGAAHLAGLDGDEAWIQSASMQRLHAAPGGESLPSYAMGWMLEESDGEALHLHAGSAGTFYAFLCIIPESGLVVAVAMNDGDLMNDALARKILSRLRQDAVAP